MTATDGRGADHVTDERVTQLFNLADEIIRAPSRFTKDFVVMELGKAVAELAGAVERARANVAELEAERSVEWANHWRSDTGIDYYNGPFETAAEARGSFGCIGGEFVLVTRDVGPWRTADATPQITAENLKSDHDDAGQQAMTTQLRICQSPDGVIVDWKDVILGDYTMFHGWPDSAGRIRLEFREYMTPDDRTEPTP